MVSATVAAAGEPVLEEVLDAMDGIAYAVDAEDRIIAVGRRRWDRFAIENGAPELRADSIVGRNLFEFVSGPDMRQAYRDLADRIVSTGEPAVDCRSLRQPWCRAGTAPVDRSAGPRGQRGRGCCFRPDRRQDRRGRALDIFDFKALLSALKQEADLPIVTMCSFCQRLRRPGAGDDEDWVSAETYYRLGGTSRVRISHGLCADCDAARFPDL